MLNYKVLNHFTKKSNYYFAFVDQVIVSLCNFLVSIIIIRLLGKDLLKVKFNTRSSYWISRDKNIGSMKKQF